MEALNVSIPWLGDHDVYNTLVDLAVMQRDMDTIREYAPQAERLARRYGHKLYLAIIQRAQGVEYCLAGKYQQAEEQLKTALAQFTELNTRWQIGRTLFELGELAKVQGDAIEARTAFTQALAAFEEMKAAPDASRARATLSTLVITQ